MKRDALSDPYIPEKVRKAARRVITFIEENGEAFDEGVEDVLHQITSTEDPPLEAEVGDLLVDREMEDRDKQMLLVFAIKDDDKYLVRPIRYKEEGYDEETIKVMLRCTKQEKGKLYPYVRKGCGRAVALMADTIYIPLKDTYVNWTQMKKK